MRPASRERVRRKLGTQLRDTSLRLADRSELDFQIRDALAAAARIRGSQGDAAGAAELYRRILGALDENAPERGMFEMRLAELGLET